jgi:hypothetical protein
VLYFIAERLHMPVTTVECMSVRQVNGWLAWFQEQQTGAAPDDALDLHTLTPAQLRGMFR